MDFNLIAYLSVSAFAAWLIWLGDRRINILRDELAMARHVIAELAPKAKDWDEERAKLILSVAHEIDRDIHAKARAWDVVAGNKRANWNDLTDAPPANEYGIAYAHMTAECDGCEDLPAGADVCEAPAPAVHPMWNYR